MPKTCFLFVCLAALASGQSFDSTVGPLFKAKCVACHGAGAPQAKLDLRTEEAALKGGASGPSIVPGAAAKSLLLDKVVTGQMPPGQKLTEAETNAIRAWVDKMPAAAPAMAVSEHEVRGILQARCVVCHGSGDKKGGLDLRTMASRLKGGKSGPALVPGKPEASLLYKKIVDGQMPPEKPAKALAVELPTEAETEKIRAWIAAGAPGPETVAKVPAISEKDKQFWSFQPPVRPAAPAVKDKASVKNAIDQFVLARLEGKGMRYSPEADRLTLLRRATLDLTGLPPTPAEIAAFTADQSADAYDKLIDRLLASPRYGERWGQHWLDLAGYSDSEGFGQDDGVRRFAWRYRDYVIRSLNADKPYSQFLTEQLAGDEMSDDWKKANGVASQEVLDRLAATGFLRTTPDPTNSAERGLLSERMNIVADELEVLTSSVMGLTVGCARCHNHKYDPIPQRDHYRLSAILQGAYDPYEWRTPNKRELNLALESERKEADAHNAPIQADIKKLQAQLEKAATPFRTMLLEERLKTLPEGVREDLRVPADQRTEAQKYLAEKFKSTVTISDRELERKYPEFASQAQPVQRELQALRGKLKPKPHVRVLTDNTEPSQHYLLRRGEPASFGEVVEAGVPTVLANAALKPYAPAPQFAGTTGRRLGLAQWLTQPNHPLTARVAVNQMWMRHFGRGIVPTVANFGRSGIAPSHPELLDWLATEFVAKGWSMKQMHRLMMTSQAYRQSSKVDQALLSADPENALLTRMPLRRMDAETLYDSMITASGRLNAKSFGPPTDVDIRPDKEVTVKADKEGFRRSIYVLHRRQTPVSLMDAFDQPAMTPNCTERRRSNVATQALHMFNGSMTWELARYMAGRVIDDADGDRARQVELVYLRALSRKPTEAEVKTGMEAIASFREAWPARLASDNGAEPRAGTASWLAVANFCHAILNSAEFSFID
ncbi:MAG TPA: PSD1 and planctomycete cytochrome C domain-containing protein [Bryobacteraceae bacterium]|nr:PSD1 and planctomycete cytochrome C domain-containing protein [Bryobacteraceae bacterium]